MNPEYVRHPNQPEVFKVLSSYNNWITYIDHRLQTPWSEPAINLEHATEEEFLNQHSNPKKGPEWWEDATFHLNKMLFPDYIKDSNGVIHKIEHYDIEVNIKALNDENIRIPLKGSTPATEEDYLNQFPLP